MKLYGSAHALSDYVSFNVNYRYCNIASRSTLCRSEVDIVGMGPIVGLGGPGSSIFEHSTAVQLVRCLNASICSCPHLYIYLTCMSAEHHSLDECPFYCCECKQRMEVSIATCTYVLCGI